jgi:hypothetical protein
MYGSRIVEKLIAVERYRGMPVPIFIESLASYFASFDIRPGPEWSTQNDVLICGHRRFSSCAVHSSTIVDMCPTRCLDGGRASEAGRIHIICIYGEVDITVDTVSGR